jgi:hypothetical protein
VHILFVGTPKEQSLSPIEREIRQFVWKMLPESRRKGKEKY